MKKRFLISTVIFLFILSVVGVEFAMADKKYTTEVTVYVNGKLRKGCKVSLEFIGGLLGGGFTDSYYTDSNGTAYVKHASEGKVKVYVDGNYSSHETQGKAPGKINVYLK